MSNKSTNGSKSAAVEAEEFVQLKLDRPAFKAEAFASRVEGTKIEKYNGPAAQGYVLNLLDMPEMTEVDEKTGETRKRAWQAYTLQATAPTKAFDRNGDVVEVQPGEEFIVAATAILKQAIPEAAANHPEFMAHVQILPTERKPVKNKPNQKMWDYKVGVSTKLVKRSAHAGSILAQLAASGPKHLEPSGAIDTTGEQVS